MASQSRSQRRRQQQRAQGRQRPAAPAPGRPIDKHPSPPKADLAAPADTTALAENEAEGRATSAVQEEVVLPTSSAISPRSHGVGRAAPEREMATSVSSRRQRRQVRPAAEPVDYTPDYDVARHDLRRIAIIATLLIAVMVALRVSGAL
mgnify:CR=1 FL=1|jgi:hypothetical protein